MHSKIKLIVCGMLLLSVMGLIFYFSSQEADSSQNLSDGLLYDIMSFFGFEEAAKNEFLGKLIRKMAHFAEYAALGFSMCMFLYALEAHRGEMAFHIPKLSFWLSALYAVSDELHQFFVPGRSMQLSDMLLDSFGAAAGIFVLLLIRKLITIHREERKNLE